MKSQTKTICFQISALCPQPVSQVTAPQTIVQQKPSSSQRLQQMLHQSLSQQASTYTHQIDQLSAQVFKLKSLIQRLQLRNKCDRQAEAALKIQYNQLLDKYRQQSVVQTVPVIQKQIVQVIKTVPVQVQSPTLVEELARLAKTITALNGQIGQLKTNNNLLQAENQSLKQQVAKLLFGQQRLNNQILDITRDRDQKQITIHKLTELNVFLKNNKEVVREVKHLFPDFKNKQRTFTETKVQTVYVQKPVEKAVFMQVPLRIKEFVQPQRPLVSNVVTCAPCVPCAPVNCVCQGQEEQVNYKEEIARMDKELNALQSNIDLFSQQRQKLVGIIGDQNSELNSLQTKMRFMQQVVSRGSNDPKITVSVSRQKQQTYVDVSDEQERKQVPQRITRETNKSTRQIGKATRVKK